jgi:hypothetical protein
MTASYTCSQSFTSAQVNPKKTIVNPRYSRSPVQFIEVLHQSL